MSIAVTIGVRRRIPRWLGRHGVIGVVDVMFAFPVLLLALAIVAILGPQGVTTTMLAIGVVLTTPIFARVARGQHAVGSRGALRRGVPHDGARGPRVRSWPVTCYPTYARPLIVQTSLSLAFPGVLSGRRTLVPRPRRAAARRLGGRCSTTRGSDARRWGWRSSWRGDDVRDRSRSPARRQAARRVRPAGRRRRGAVPLLEVEGSGSATTRRQPAGARGVSFAVEPGEIVGFVGESGCGKCHLWRSCSCCRRTAIFERQRRASTGRDLPRSRARRLRRCAAGRSR